MEFISAHQARTIALSNTASRSQKIRIDLELISKQLSELILDTCAKGECTVERDIKFDSDYETADMHFILNSLRDELHKMGYITQIIPNKMFRSFSIAISW